MADNWEKAKQVFAEAIKLSPELRLQYIREICADDPDTRREVESLLSSFDDAESFMENPAADEFADLIKNRGKKHKRGTCLGHYEIIEQIGSGGMGEVYLAKDKKLDRKVAVKILNEKFAGHESNLNRFIQEAKAASALNHPNILVIHEIGETDSGHYIVSEYIEGKTLRKVINERTLQLAEVLDIGIQVAGALSSAHKANIVHRDIKPENIMIRPDAVVKILDFGLAKLIKQKTVGFDDETLKQNQTAKGVIMGTVSYMSPEQVKGIKIDQRTDIFSFGVILYEMLTRRLPFAGDSMNEVIASILKTDPIPLRNFNSAFPKKLDEILAKTLEKNREERYQTVNDLLIDLQRLSKRLEFESEKESLNATEFTEESGVNQSEKETQILAQDTNSAPINIHTASGLGYITSKIKRHKSLSLGVLAFLVLIGIGFTVYKLSVSEPLTISAETPFTSPQKLKFTRLTSTGNVIAAAISPDGKYAAYSINDRGKYSLRLRQIATTSDVEIVATVEERPRKISFTPDGDYLYYLSGETIFKVPAIGGAPKKIAENVFRSVTVSPDGKTIAFFRNKNEKTSLVFADADGSNERTSFTSDANDFITFAVGPAWSTDGKMVACAISKDRSVTKLFNIGVLDGSINQVNDTYWTYIEDLVWLPNGNLIVNGAPKSEAEAEMSLWLIAPDIAPHRITSNLDNFSRLRTTAKGDVLISLQDRHVKSILITPNNKVENAAQIAAESNIDQIQWTPDGRLIFSLSFNEVWIMNADGTNQKPLTSGHEVWGLSSIIQGGRYIAFVSGLGEPKGLKIWRMDVDGGNEKQLTFGSLHFSPNISPDAKWVIYGDLSTSAPNTIWKVPIEGGAPVQLSSLEGNDPKVSPVDGKIAFQLKEEQEGSRKIVILPPDGGTPIEILPLPKTASKFKWTPDGRAIAYIDSKDNVENIWTIALGENSQPKPVTNFKSEKIWEYAWSLDGKQLAVIRETKITDAVLIGETR